MISNEKKYTFTYKRISGYRNKSCQTWQFNPTDTDRIVGKGLDILGPYLYIIYPRIFSRNFCTLPSIKEGFKSFYDTCAEHNLSCTHGRVQKFLRHLCGRQSKLYVQDIFGLEMDLFGNQLETIPYTCYTMYLIALFHAMVQKIASREHAHNCSWEKLANCWKIKHCM